MERLGERRGRLRREGSGRAQRDLVEILRLNGIEPLPDSDEWEKLMLDVAASQIEPAATTRRLRKLLPRSRTLLELKRPRKR